MNFGRHMPIVANNWSSAACSGTSVSGIRETISNDFEINVFPPTELLMQGSDPEEAVRWLDKTVSENQGGLLQIAYHLEADYDIVSGLVIHKELEKRGLLIPGRLY